jgi:hypothetical protein
MGCSISVSVITIQADKRCQTVSLAMHGSRLVRVHGMKGAYTSLGNLTRIGKPPRTVDEMRQLGQPVEGVVAAEVIDQIIESLRLAELVSAEGRCLRGV